MPSLPSDERATRDKAVPAEADTRTDADDDDSTPLPAYQTISLESALRHARARAAARVR